VLVYLRKAELIHARPDAWLRSATQQFSYPSVIRLFRYVQAPYRRVALSRENIFRRDGYRCQYCGSTQHLTLDHVTPRSMGGRDTWENLVTACQQCNSAKGNRTLEQSGLRLAQPPRRPSYVLFLTEFAPQVEPAWQPYLMLS